MNSRPLLDYLAYPDEHDETPLVEPASDHAPVDPLEARLKDLELRLRTGHTAASAPTRDLTLSTQIEAILRRKQAPQPVESEPAAPATPGYKPAAPQSRAAEQASRPARVALDPPPSVPVANDVPSVDQDFLRFTEAVYLIGQAAKRFIEEPQMQAHAQIPIHGPVAAPSTGDVEALSAVLRETVSAFRSVADDLAVSAGEIRNFATRPERMMERMPEWRSEPMPDYPAERRRRPQYERQHDEDEILELRESIADLQHRLDDLMQARRRARY